MLARISNQKAILHIESSLGIVAATTKKQKPSIIMAFFFTMHFVLRNHEHEYQ